MLGLSATSRLLHSRLRPVLPWLVYSALALVTLGPLLRPGYVLTLDMVFAPHIRLVSPTNNTYLLYGALRLLNVAMAGDVIQKIVLLAVWLLAGMGMHTLARRLQVGEAGSYVAGMLYAINPFIYDRLMAGQYEVLLGYALLPWVVGSLLAFLDRPDTWGAVRLVFGILLISIVSIHTVGMIVLIMAMGCFAAVVRYRRRPGYLCLLGRFGLLTVLATVVLSSYWVIPLAMGKGGTATAIAHFGAGDRHMFATVGSGTLGRVGNVIRLQGFWAEGRGLYKLPQTGDRAWGLLALLIWLLVAIGATKFWREDYQRFALATIGGSAIIATGLAVGITNDWLSTHIPLFAGYREPEKFVAILALAFALCVGRSAAEIIRYCYEQRWWLVGVFAAVLLLLLPVVFTPTLLWGAQGQLRAARYPDDWVTANKFLNADRSSFKVLFLPWHLYMYFGFAGRIAATPAPLFFDKPVISSDNPEYGTATPSTATPAQQSIDDLLRASIHSQDVATRLALLQVKYIILAKEDDYGKYSSLTQQPGIQIVSNGPGLSLYRNEAVR